MKNQWPELSPNDANHKSRDTGSSTNPKLKKNEGHYAKNIIIKLLKTSNKETILKSGRQKKKIHYIKSNKDKNYTEFSSETMGA